jgi:polysaccharide export outer membrane protein
MPLLLVACSHPVKDGIGLEADPNFGGNNLTDEMRGGQFFIGPGDQIDVDIWDNPDLSRTYIVEPDDVLKCHLIEPLSLGPETTWTSLRNQLTDAYAEVLVEPSIALTITLSMLRKVTVLGSVNQPGVFPMESPNTSVLEIIAMAGGISSAGDTTGIVLARQVKGKTQVRNYNLDLLFDPSLDDPPVQIPFVRPGDYLFVLRTGKSEYGEYLRLVSETLRGISWGQQTIMNSPDVYDQLFGGD